RRETAEEGGVSKKPKIEVGAVGKVWVAMIQTPEGVVEVKGDRRAVDSHVEFVKRAVAAERRRPAEVYRDAGTGEFVTPEYAAETPGTTVKERAGGRAGSATRCARSAGPWPGPCARLRGAPAGEGWPTWSTRSGRPR